MQETTPSFAIHMSKLTRYSNIKNVSNTTPVCTFNQYFTYI